MPALLVNETHRSRWAEPLHRGAPSRERGASTARRPRRWWRCCSPRIAAASSAPSLPRGDRARRRSRGRSARGGRRAGARRRRHQRAARRARGGRVPAHVRHRARAGARGDGGRRRRRCSAPARAPRTTKSAGRDAVAAVGAERRGARDLRQLGDAVRARRARRRPRARRRARCCSPAPTAAASRRCADIVVALDTGPEILTGSTRLKAGSATKAALNAITTAAMVRLGKTYENLMVDLRAGSAKLADRARRIVEVAGRVASDEAERLLAAAGGEVKTAIAMARLGVDADEARRGWRRPAATCAGPSARPPEPPFADSRRSIESGRWRVLRCAPSHEDVSVRRADAYGGEKRMKRLLGLLATRVPAPCAPLAAQSTGSITGMVTAPGGDALPGVTVEATSDVLPQAGRRPSPKATAPSASRCCRRALQAQLHARGHAEQQRSMQRPARQQLDRHRGARSRGARAEEIVVVETSRPDRSDLGRDQDRDRPPTSSTACRSARTTATCRSSIPGVQYSEDADPRPERRRQRPGQRLPVRRRQRHACRCSAPSPRSRPRTTSTRSRSSRAAPRRSTSTAPRGFIDRLGQQVGNQRLPRRRRATRCQPDSLRSDRETPPSDFERGPRLGDRRASADRSCATTSSSTPPTTARRRPATTAPTSTATCPTSRATRDEFFGKLSFQPTASAPAPRQLPRLRARGRARRRRRVRSGDARRRATTPRSSIGILEGNWMITSNSFADLQVHRLREPDRLDSRQPAPRSRRPPTAASARHRQPRQPGPLAGPDPARRRDRAQRCS